MRILLSYQQYVHGNVVAIGTGRCESVLAMASAVARAYNGSVGGDAPGSWPF